MRADAAVAGTAPGTANVQGSVLRLLGWCVAVLMIAAALLPMVPRLGGPRTALTLEIGGELDRVPAEAVRGGAETMYPEYRKKISEVKLPAGAKAVASK